MKRNIEIAEIWSSKSVHYLDYCALAMSRERYQLLSRHITFDDVALRGSNTDCGENQDKFFKM